MEGQQQWQQQRQQQGQQEVVLALPGPQYWYNWPGGEFKVGGVPIYLAPEGGQGRGTGWAVWDGAVAAALHLQAASAQLRPQLLQASAPCCTAAAAACASQSIQLDPTRATTPPASSSPSPLQPLPLQPLPSNNSSASPASGRGMGIATRVLELGSGTGLLSLAAAAALRLPVVATDVAEVLPALRRTVDLNPQLKPLVAVRECDWLQPLDLQCLAAAPALDGGSSSSGCSTTTAAAASVSGHITSSSSDGSGGDGNGCGGGGSAASVGGGCVGGGSCVGGGPFALVLAADCVWVEELVAPFVRTLAAVCSRETRILMAHQSRSEKVDRLMFRLLDREAGLSWREAQLLPGEQPRGKIQLYWLRRHEEQQKQ